MTQYNVQFQDGNGSLAGFRNLLINGLFSVNQRSYVSATNTTAANEFTVDRWFVNTSGQNLTFTTSQNSTTATAPAGGLSQAIEGDNIQTGTYTLSWVGTATAQVNGVAVLNGGIVTLTGGVNAVVKFSGGTVTKPQLEPGPVATPFEQRPYGVEIMLCQRYYQKSYPYDTAPGTGGSLMENKAIRLIRTTGDSVGTVYLSNYMGSVSNTVIYSPGGTAGQVSAAAGGSTPVTSLETTNILLNVGASGIGDGLSFLFHYVIEGEITS
jgi:hypothetical protein